MIMIYTGTLTPLGITLRRSEMIKFDIMRTAMVATPIPRPFFALVVTARVGHIPSIRTKTGFSLTIPL